MFLVWMIIMLGGYGVVSLCAMGILSFFIKKLSKELG
jgi:hypothetical protein